MNRRKIKGFTLVELIIVMALMSVLMVMVGLIMKPISQVFADTTRYTEERYIIDGMGSVIEENLRYATDICIIYDTDARPLSGSGLSTVAGEMQVPESKLQVLAIINRCPDASMLPEFTTNNGVEATGRIYKSAEINGTRNTWLVGGEAFYGDGSYFVNLENTAGVTHMSSGNIKYTIYSFDPKEYAKRDALDVEVMLSAMRDHTRDEIKAYPFNNVISNYAEKGVAFVNNPDFGTIWTDGTDTHGWVSPIDGKDGASHSQGNAGDYASVPASEGYNIFIYYTVPD